MKGIGKAEWDYTGVPKDELKICQSYEFAREVVILDREKQHSISDLDVSGILWLENVVLEIRKDAGFENFDKGLDCGFLLAPDLLVIVLYPEWPDCPYLLIDLGERHRRAVRLE